MPADTLQDLESRLGKIEDLGSVVSTMKSLAAVNIDHFVHASSAAGKYYSNIMNALHVLIINKPEKIDFPDKNLQGNIIVAIGSDQGMVGRFNETVAEKINEKFGKAENQNQKNKDKILALGQRVASSLLSIGYEIEEEFTMAGNLEDAVETVRDLLEYVSSGERAFKPVWLVYNEPEGGSSYKSVSRRVFPLDKKLLGILSGQPWKGVSIPLTRYSWEKMFFEITREYLFISLYSAVVQSLAAENAARLAAMQTAEKNIDEKKDEVRALFNRKRQSAITAELLDIVGGFEALK
ncbi:MAG: F0F1 ATP synthase subunit gamma [Spirochaetia bacterium]|jgi:F-type H+-transporting ATPase subunit gamma|nr:F0F1 ATP synthase subunit gamma [Spirochaetia bacterium]